jgi:FRG domain-containing protein
MRNCVRVELHIMSVPIPSTWSAQELRDYVERWIREGTGVDEERWGDNPFPRFYSQEQAATWKEFVDWQDQLEGSWCFRGQGDLDWGLCTSLDRALRREERTEHTHSIYHGDRSKESREVLFRFKQQAHLHLNHLPADDDVASWIALMQHYGAPTAFLDWTASPYVAMYFALEKKREEGKCSAVWAIDLDWLERVGRKLLKAGEETFALEPTPRAERINGLLTRTILGPEKEALTIRVDPMKSNDRIAAQQGIFLCRLYHWASFGQTLMSMLMHTEIPDLPVIRKLGVQGSMRSNCLHKLRSMNIDRTSLFPGLDGFGQSLRLELELKKLL